MESFVYFTMEEGIYRCREMYEWPWWEPRPRGHFDIYNSLPRPDNVRFFWFISERIGDTTMPRENFLSMKRFCVF